VHISEDFERVENNERLEKADITDIVSQESERDLTVDIQSSILMTNTLNILVQNYHDIFSTTVKKKSDRVPSLDFKNDAAWETTANRLPSRQISLKKHLGLHGVIEELQGLNVIKPNRDRPTVEISQLITGAFTRS